MSTQELLDRFGQFMVTDRQSAPQTVRFYKTDISAFFDSLANNENAIVAATEADINKYFETMRSQGSQNATISRKMSSLSIFYKFLIATGQRTDNPVKAKRPKVEKVDRTISDDSVKTILSKCDTSTFKGSRDRCILEMVYSNGLKLSEALALDNSDVNIVTKQINVKGKSIAVSPEFMSLLETYYANRQAEKINNDSNALFVNRSGARLTNRTAVRGLHECADKSGIGRISPRILRQSANKIKAAPVDTEITGCLGNVDKEPIPTL